MHMARIFFDKDADLENLKDMTIGIIGYGNQGRAQALNLRDSGVQVVIGNPSDAYADIARTDGFEVFSISEASERADLLCILVPDEVMAHVYERHIAAHLRFHVALNFASGYNITFKQIVPPEHVDVTMVAPRMIGRGVRETYLSKMGFPSLIAVEQNASGRALDIALAMAKAIGSTRMGAIQSTFAEETLIDLFTEQSGDLLLIPRLMFEILVEEGCDPDVVIMELYGSGEMSEMYAAARDLGLWGQLRLHSRTSQYGQQVTSRNFLDMDAIRSRFRRVIQHVRSGDFAREWRAEYEAGLPNLINQTNENLQHPMQLAENHLYQLLGRRDRDLSHADWLVSGKEET